MTVLATGQLEEALAQIASALRVPVLSLALLALLICALELGRFGAELFSRRRGRASMRALTLAALADPAQARLAASRAPSAFAAEALLEVSAAVQVGDLSGIERALAAYELAAERCLDRTRILVRAGPALGLMGTLIPLAPGLAALGQGHVATLASDLRTAFAATTVGLLVGTLAYALTVTRTRLYGEDLAGLEYALPPGERMGGRVAGAVRSDRGTVPLPPPASKAAASETVASE